MDAADAENVLPVVVAASVCVMVVTSLLSVLSPVAKGLMMLKAFRLLPTYPRLPTVLRRDVAVKRCVYALWMNVLRPG